MKFKKKINYNEADVREQIIFGESYSPYKYKFGGTRSFDNVNVKTARKLIDEGFLDPEETQNSSPEALDMIEFVESMKEPDDWYFHGYSVSPDRNDCRVTFEGIGSYSELSAEEAIDFLKEFRYADELSCDVNMCAYCWYD